MDQDFKLIGNTVHVSNASGQEIFVVNKEIFTILPKYVVRFSNGQQITLKSKFSLFKKAIDVDAGGHNLILEGDFMDHDFRLLDNGRLLGNIQKAYLTWGDTYQLTVHDENMQDLIVAIMIAVDCIKDSEQKNKR